MSVVATITLEGSRRLLESSLTCKKHPLYIRLYCNDEFPKQIISDHLFLEPEGTGYQPLELKADRWVSDADYPTMHYRDPVIWDMKSPLGELYGYYITDKDQHIIAACRLPTPVIHPPNCPIKLQVSMGLRY